jgi:hypothetical protein
VKRRFWNILSICCLTVPLAAQGPQTAAGGRASLAAPAPPVEQAAQVEAPAEVEAALRESVAKFYQAHVDGKFRLADAVVAEDSKDAFFAASKERYRSFEIVRANFSEDLQAAQVVVACDTDFVMPFGGKRIPMKAPVTSLWKLEEGEWRWYVLPRDAEVQPSPFGAMAQGEEQGGAVQVRAPGDVNSLLSGVKVTKDEILFPADAASEDSLTIQNNMQGYVKLSVNHPDFRGLRFELDRQDVAPGETATLTVKWEPTSNAPKPTCPARIVVWPTQQTFPLLVKFALPAQGPAAGAQIDSEAMRRMQQRRMRQLEKEAAKKEAARKKK